MARGLSIEIRRLDRAVALVKVLEVDSRVATEVHRRMGVQVMRWIDQNFRAEGVETKWKPLAASTIFARRKGSSEILQDTGRHLKASFSFRADATEAVIGSPSPLARWHHFGTDPYTIRPKKAKALKFVAAPMSSLKTGKVRTALVRRKKGTPKVGVVSAKAASSAGLKIPKGRGDLQSVIFATVVHHPGLTARPLLPSKSAAETIAFRVLDGYIKERLKTQAPGGQE